MKKFTGILARPMPEVSSSELQHRYLALKQEKAEREAALVEHFGYAPDDPDAWYHVALALAEFVVPAYKPKRGRPPISDLYVEGWARYWVALRLTGVPTDTKAFEIITGVVKSDLKTVRTRLKAYRRKYPEQYDRIERDSVRAIKLNGLALLLECARGNAESKVFDLWRIAADFEVIQGRPMPQELRDMAETIREVRGEIKHFRP